MCTNVVFDALPLAGVGVDAVAPATNRNEAGEDFDFREGGLEFLNGFTLFNFGTAPPGHCHYKEKLSGDCGGCVAN